MRPVGIHSVQDPLGRGGSQLWVSANGDCRERHHGSEEDSDEQICGIHAKRSYGVSRFGLRTMFGSTAVPLSMKFAREETQYLGVEVKGPFLILHQHACETNLH